MTKLEYIRSKAIERHGQGGPHPTKTYMVWGAMIQRCTNAGRADFYRYGGRGITVSTRWRKFENFLADMGEKPEGKSLDRIDNTQGYSRFNCRWATLSEQALNRRNTHLLTFKSKTQSLTEWARETGINRETLLSRVKLGWDIDRIMDKRHGNATRKG